MTLSIGLMYQGGRVVPPPPARSVVSGGSGSIFGDEMFEEEENPCTVCLGELETGDVSKLDCGHIYHTEVRHTHWPSTGLAN